MRGGTENLMGIVGMSVALEIANQEMESNRKAISEMKTNLRNRLMAEISDLKFNGLSGADSSLYSILNLSLPPSPFGEMLLANLDIRGIAVSGGSACSSGSDIGSHVLRAMKADPSRPSVRISFSKFNQMEELDVVCSAFRELYPSMEKA